MRDAPNALRSVHDRVPLLIPAEFASTRLTSAAPDLVDQAWAESDRALAEITATPIPARPLMSTGIPSQRRLRRSVEGYPSPLRTGATPTEAEPKLRGSDRKVRWSDRFR